MAQYTPIYEEEARRLAVELCRLYPDFEAVSTPRGIDIVNHRDGQARCIHTVTWQQPGDNPDPHLRDLHLRQLRLGHRLRAALESAGVNPTELSQRLGYHRGFLHSVMHGTTGIYAVQLQQVLDAAGLTIEFKKKK